MHNSPNKFQQSPRISVGFFCSVRPGVKLGKTNNSSLRMLTQQLRRQLLTPDLGQNPNNCEVRSPKPSSAWSEWTTPSLAPDRTIIRLGRLPAGELGVERTIIRFDDTQYTLHRTIIRFLWDREAEANNKKNGKGQREAWAPKPNKSESEVRIRARHTDWASPTLYATPNTPSVHAIFGVLCYHVLSSVGLYGSLWLLSCVSVQVIEILVAFPVFVLLSCYQLAHVAREPCLQAVQ